jgi:hypothetical protein
MTKETRKRIVENVKVFQKERVGFYLDDVAREKLDRMSKELTHSEHGRSATMGWMIGFCNAHIVNLKAWVENEGNR